MQSALSLFLDVCRTQTALDLRFAVVLIRRVQVQSVSPGTVSDSMQLRYYDL